MDFQRATEIFRDPLALTIPDDEHSADQARWITLGKDMAGKYIVVIHTFEEVTSEAGRIRVISARLPTAREMRAYEQES